MRLNDDPPPAAVLTEEEMKGVTRAIHDLESCLLWFRRNEIRLKVELGEDVMVLTGHNYEGQRLFRVKGMIMHGVKGEA